MKMNEAQKVVLDACCELGMCLFQDGEHNGNITFDGEPEYYEHDDLVRIAPFVRRLIVVQAGDGEIQQFGFECKFPVTHFRGYIRDWSGTVRDELVEVLRLLASEYGISFEHVIREWE